MTIIINLSEELSPKNRIVLMKILIKKEIEITQYLFEKYHYALKNIKANNAVVSDVLDLSGLTPIQILQEILRKHRSIFYNYYQALFRFDAVILDTPQTIIETSHNIDPMMGLTEEVELSDELYGWGRLNKKREIGIHFATLQPVMSGEGSFGQAHSCRTIYGIGADLDLFIKPAERPSKPGKVIKFFSTKQELSRSAFESQATQIVADYLNSKTAILLETPKKIGEFFYNGYMVMRKLPGDNLNNYLAENYLNTDFTLFERWKLMQNLILAMHAMHERGIIHRDLKARNVMYTPMTGPNIIDFGLAKNARHNDGSSTAGSVRYLAPEIIWRNDTPSSYKSDLFSSVYSIFYKLFFYNLNVRNSFIYSIVSMMYYIKKAPLNSIVKSDLYQQSEAIYNRFFNLFLDRDNEKHLEQYEATYEILSNLIQKLAEIASLSKNEIFSSEQIENYRSKLDKIHEADLVSFTQDLLKQEDRAFADCFQQSVENNEFNPGISFEFFKSSISLLLGEMSHYFPGHRLSPYRALEKMNVMGQQFFKPPPLTNVQEMSTSSSRECASSAFP